MASFERDSCRELEAGAPLSHDNAMVDDKGRTAGISLSPPPPKPRCSALRRVLVVVASCIMVSFVFAHVARFRLSPCMHNDQSGAADKADKATTDASSLSHILCTASPDRVRRFLYPYCPEMVDQVTDDAIESGQADEPADGAVAGALDKRQENGSNSTTSSNEASSTTSNRETSTTSPEETSTRQPRDPTTTTQDPTSTSTEHSATSETTTSERSITTPETSSEQETTSSVRSTPTSVETTSSEEESTSARRTITTGSVTTSSAERHTFTRTLEDGGVTVVTSVSWVAVVPPEETGDSDPELQNAASRSSGAMALQAAFAVFAIFAGAMLWA